MCRRSKAVSKNPGKVSTIGQTFTSTPGVFQSMIQESNKEMKFAFAGGNSATALMLFYNVPSQPIIHSSSVTVGSKQSPSVGLVHH
jgi:hypothetical protein